MRTVGCSDNSTWSNFVNWTKRQFNTNWTKVTHIQGKSQMHLEYAVECFGTILTNALRSNLSYVNTDIPTQKIQLAQKRTHRYFISSYWLWHRAKAHQEGKMNIVQKWREIGFKQYIRPQWKYYATANKSKSLGTKVIWRMTCRKT